MGTDIHPVVQVRQHGVWVTHEWPFAETHGVWSIPDEQKTDTQKAYLGLESRNYQKFAILAGVRNGHGFAGVKTGDPVEPIAECRGLPNDFAYDPEDFGENWLGEHSFTWMTLQEILDWPGWDQPITHRGMVNKATKHDERGRPESWCGGVWGQGSEDYIHEAWEDDLRESIGWFWTATIPYLKTLAVDPNEVRIVMGFDS